MDNKERRIIAASSGNIIATWTEEGKDKWVERFYFRDKETHQFRCRSDKWYLTEENVMEYCRRIEEMGCAVSW